MTTEPDFYAILGVGRDATQADISSAYRRLLRDHHPDTTSDPQPPAALERILAAYAVLRDPARRAQYARRHRPKPAPRRTPAEDTSPSRRRTNMTIRVSPVRYHGPGPGS